MARNNASVFVDSSEFDSAWLDGGWSDATDGAAFVGGSAKVTNGTGALRFSFDGTLISVSGFVPAVDQQWFVSMDSGPSSGLFQAPPIFPNSSTTAWWGIWMNSFHVNAGFNSALMSRMPQGVVADFVAIQPPFSSSIKGKKIIIDDADLLLVYTGTWNKLDSQLFNVSQSLGAVVQGSVDEKAVPYNGGVHRSSTIGDIIQFPFTGTSVSVYSVVEWKTFGNITLAFSIDGNTTSTASFPPAETPNTFSRSIITPNYNFYTSPTLDAGDHILTMEIKEIVGGQSFMLDFVHYTAAFDSLDSMPQIAVPSPTTLSTSTSTPTSKKSNAGAIAGGVVGGLVLLFVLAGALFLLRRRSRRAEEEVIQNASPNPFMDTGVGHIEKSRSTNGLLSPGYPSPTDGTELTSMSWNEATGSTFTSRSTKGGLLSPQTPSAYSSLPPGAASPTSPGSSSAAAERVRELERQVQELAGEVQELRPPPYSDAGGEEHR